MRNILGDHSWQVERLLRYMSSYTKARRGFLSLLENSANERQAHSYLSKHPILLLNAVTGGFFPVDSHRIGVIDRVRFGNELETDFAAVHTDSNGAWWTFVELESPQARLFTRRGDPTKTLTHAIRQVTDWSTWLIENRSYALRTLRELAHKKGFRCERFWRPPHFMVIIGRRESLDESSNRRRAEICNQNPRLHIVTYDRIVEPFGHDMCWGPNGNAEDMYPHDDVSVADRHFLDRVTRAPRRTKHRLGQPSID